MHTLNQAGEIGHGDRVVLDVGGHDLRRHLDNFSLVVHDFFFRFVSND
jgi:hypothetical protein